MLFLYPAPGWDEATVDIDNAIALPPPSSDGSNSDDDDEKVGHPPFPSRTRIVGGLPVRTRKVRVRSTDDHSGSGVIATTASAPAPTSAPIIASPAMTPARRNMRTPPHPRYLSSSASGFTTESTDSDSSAWFRAPTDDSADETADAEIRVIPVVASPWSSSARDPPHKRRATMLTDRRDLKRDRHSPKHPTSADDDIDTPTTQSSDGVRRRRHRTARVRTDDATPPGTPSPACGSSPRHHPTGLAAPVWDRSGAGASASISAPIETSAAPASAARSPGPPATPRRSERVRHPTEHLGMARGVTSKSLHRRDDSSSAWEEDFSDTDDGREKDFSDGDCTS